MIQHMYQTNAWLFTLLVIGITVLVFVLGSAFTRKYFPSLILPTEDNAVANIIIRQSSTLLSVLMAFIVISMWQDYETQRNNTAYEAVIMGNLYRDSRGFDVTKEQKIQSLLVNYTTLVVEDGWPKMLERKESHLAWISFNELYGYIIRMEPTNSREEIIFRQAIDNMHELARFRRLRHLRNSNPFIPDLLWTTVYSITIFVLFSNFLLHMQNRRAQKTFTIISALIFGMIFSLLLLLNHPYSSALQISPSPIENLLKDVFPAAEMTQIPS